jgi:predicted DNA-binding transcriptional regulator AlpA
MQRWYLRLDLEHVERDLIDRVFELMDPDGKVVVEAASIPHDDEAEGDFSIDLHLDANGPIEAFNIAFQALGEMNLVGHLVAGRVRDGARLDREHLEDQLLGVRELASELGVSPQRVSELWKKNRSFPNPWAQLASGPVWRRSEIDDFIASWPRKGGRPRSGMDGATIAAGVAAAGIAVAAAVVKNAAKAASKIG